MTSKKWALGIIALTMASSGCRNSNSPAGDTTPTTSPEEARRGQVEVQGDRPSGATQFLGQWAFREGPVHVRLSLRPTTFEYLGGLTTYRGDWKVTERTASDYVIQLTATQKREPEESAGNVAKAPGNVGDVTWLETSLSPPVVWTYEVTVVDGKITAVNGASGEESHWVDDKPVLD